MLRLHLRLRALDLLLEALQFSLQPGDLLGQPGARLAQPANPLLPHGNLASKPFALGGGLGKVLPPSPQLGPQRLGLGPQGSQPLLQFPLAFTQRIPGRLGPLRLGLLRFDEA